MGMVIWRMHNATTAKNPLRYVPHSCCIGGTSAVRKFDGQAEIPLLHCIIIAVTAEIPL